ncbi:MAG TPA: carboxypeptidase-like regulatory domain-containing protein, partial [Vicinamibacterales bacterium]
MRQLNRFLAGVAAALLLLPASAFAQARTTGQIVGTVKDASGAVVQKADVVLIDTGTGTTVETKSGADGGFVFPNLQPGSYTITATLTGFQPVTLQQIIVQTARATDVVVQFAVAGVSEAVQVEGRAAIVETTSTTVANTVSNAEIAKLPLAGRNILSFALLVPGAATSAGARDSEYNGLPGGAINITLDGVNNNSQRFRSGGTSFFTFAPIRLGAIEEVTVSTAGLTSEAGAEGAVQVQFATKRGTNVFRGQVFDTIQSDKLNANSAVNAARNLPKTKLRQHEWGANIGGPIVKNRLFFFANYEQVYSPSESTQERTVLTPEAQSGIFRYTATDNSVRTVNLLDIARANGLSGSIDPFVASQFTAANATLGGGNLAPSTLLQNTFRFIIPNSPNVNVFPTGRVDFKATDNLAFRGSLNLHYRNLPRNPQYPGLEPVNGGFTSTYYVLSTGADWTLRSNLFNQATFGLQSNYEEFNPGNTLALYEPQGGRRITLPLMTSPQPTNDVMPIPRNNPVFNISDTLTWLRGKHTFTFGGTFRRTTMYESIGGAPYTVSLGVGTGDPASSVFTAATIPGVRANDLGTALSLYALLTGRVSTAGGTYFLDEASKQYGLNPAFRREGQNVGGLFAQDQWRLTPQLTLNYGM